MKHLSLAIAAFLITIGLMLGSAKASSSIEVYKSPTCGCCEKWVEHLKENGFTVTVHNDPQIMPIKKKQGVPEGLQSCHTAIVDGYTIEGHVPATDIKRLLTEKPKAKGLAVGGMPLGSPGMEMDDRKEPYNVILFDEAGKQTIFASH